MSILFASESGEVTIFDFMDHAQYDKTAEQFTINNAPEQRSNKSKNNRCHCFIRKTILNYYNTIGSNRIYFKWFDKIFGDHVAEAIVLNITQKF